MLVAAVMLGLVVSMAALVLSLVALLAARARRAPDDAALRLAALEAQVRALSARAAAPAPAPAVSAPPAPLTVAPAQPVAPAPRDRAAPTEPSPPAALDLEQRIGARWATWVGVVVILVAVALFLKWAMDHDYLGPVTRVSVGIVCGLLMLLGGLALHARRDVPYLGEGLAGGGLGVLYLSLFAAHVLYGLLGAPAAFAGMFAVTVLGTLVAVLSGRLSTAVLAVVGGLLTPVLLQVEQPDERNLFAYLLVLDVLALLVARFRTWPALNRVAWGGSALLILPTLLRAPDAPRPLARLVLLSAIFLVFVAVPLFRERARGQRVERIDLVLVVANAAAYFWAVYLTLEAWRPAAEGPYAVVLAVLYRLVAADYAARVPEDAATVMLHEGLSWTFLTLAVPLALGGQWITLAWAAEGAVLLWLAAHAPMPVAAWAGLVALLLAAIRVLALDRYGFPGAPPVWNLTFLIHALVVVALIAGGVFGGRAREVGQPYLRTEAIRSLLWVAATLTAAGLFWREPRGLWPATLLTVEVLVVGYLARLVRSQAFAAAIPALVIILVARVLAADDGLARSAAGTLLSWPLLSRVGACLAVGIAGGGLVRASEPGVRQVGRVISGAAGVMLLYVLSVNWTRYQDALRASAPRGLAADLRWRTQAGLSVLWALYAGAALTWGFVRANAAVRYAALALLGLTVFKVFIVDFAEVKTAYRILSFVVLGVVLLLVSLAYQKRRSMPPPAES
ncbi:MAG TPA: DUF2339 domain-containing protein [Methylomirabilota bacterium]|nr:DUF2339 domain-containing protein [Methylomirabilota bacterium]